MGARLHASLHWGGLVACGLRFSCWVSGQRLPGGYLLGWFLVDSLASTNPPAGTSNCMIETCVGCLLGSHADWRRVNIGQTEDLHWWDNFLCVSTGGCLFLCVTCVSLTFTLHLDYALASTNPPAGTPDWLIKACAGQLLNDHADEHVTKIRKTRSVHLSDNLLCVSTYGCKNVCLTCVSRL